MKKDITILIIGKNAGDPTPYAALNNLIPKLVRKKILTIYCTDFFSTTPLSLEDDIEISQINYNQAGKYINQLSLHKYLTKSKEEYWYLNIEEKSLLEIINRRLNQSDKGLPAEKIISCIKFFTEGTDALGLKTTLKEKNIKYVNLARNFEEEIFSAITEDDLYDRKVLIYMVDSNSIKNKKEALNLYLQKNNLENCNIQISSIAFNFSKNCLDDSMETFNRITNNTCNSIIYIPNYTIEKFAKINELNGYLIKIENKNGLFRINTKYLQEDILKFLEIERKRVVFQGDSGYDQLRKINQINEVTIESTEIPHEFILTFPRGLQGQIMEILITKPIIIPPAIEILSKIEIPLKSDTIRKNDASRTCSIL